MIRSNTSSASCPPMVSWQLAIAGIIGIVPAFVVLMTAYHRYDGKFRDETLFLLFMAGLFLGLPVAMLEAFLFLPLVFVFGFPAFEQMLKTVILNLPRFHDQPLMRFYGGSMGLGLGAMIVFVLAARIFLDTGRYADLGGLGADPAAALLLTMAGAGILLLQLATGIVIGEGVAKNAPFYAAAKAIVLSLPGQALLFEFLAVLRVEGTLFPPYPALMLLYGAVVAWYVVRHVLPNALPPGERRKVKKEIAGTG